MLTALSASELATAMPASGGPYHFINTGLGPLFGSIAGLGNWLGLAFATAFYAVGFGNYVAPLMASLELNLGIVVALPLSWSQIDGLVAASAFIAVNYLSTDGTGDLQNVIVIVDLLGPARVVVLGYYPVPDQAAPDQLQAEYEEEAKAAMEPTVRSFAQQGTAVESVLACTRYRTQSIDRVANELGCDAVLVPGDIHSLDGVLVSLKDETNMFSVLEVVGLLLEDGDPEVTLFHAESIEKCSAKSELSLRGATDWLRERVVGDMPNRIPDRTETDVLVVRNTEES